jgi:glycosyltransferase involved in cell wall biosynthesis
MKICIVNTANHLSGIGGMQQHTVDLAEALVRAGHDVVVITHAHPRGEDEELRNGVRWRFVAGTRDQDAQPWLEKSYAEFVSLHRERSFDVVHSESTTGHPLVMRGVHRSVPFVVMFHGVFLGLAGAALRRAFRASSPLAAAREANHIRNLARRHFRHGKWYRFRGCEAIVPSHQQVGYTSRSCLVPRSRIHVVPNGIDANLFRPRPQAAARSELGLGPGPLLVCVGRLARDKGMHHAVHALSRLPQASRLAIVGDGEERASLEELARELGLRDRVIFAGKQPAERVPAYLAAADVFVFPTERDEAAPLVLPQAMSCARPVVASSIGGITEVIDRPGENGVLVRPAHVDALAEALGRLLEDGPLRERMGEAGRARVLREYTIERMTERTLDVYRIAAERLENERNRQPGEGSRARGARA